METIFQCPLSSDEIIVSFVYNFLLKIQFKRGWVKALLKKLKLFKKKVTNKCH